MFNIPASSAIPRWLSKNKTSVNQKNYRNILNLHQVGLDTYTVVVPRNFLKKVRPIRMLPVPEIL